MANVNNPYGFRCLGRTLDGGAPQVEEFDKVVGYGTTIFPGDLVNQVADGSIEVSITPGTTLISGVALNYGALSTATKHLVTVSPGAVFEAQENAGSALVAADNGLLCNAVLTAGDTTKKQSKHQINSTGKDVTATLDLKLLMLLKVPNNDYGAYSRWEVVINKHRRNPAVVGI
jgi:hypothetical protein